MKRLSVLFAFALITSVTSIAMSAEGAVGMPDLKFKAELTGAKVPPVATRATGEVKFDSPDKSSSGSGAGSMKSGALKYDLSVRNIKDVTAAHIHMGKKASSEGPVVAALFLGPKKSGEFSGTLAQGVITDKDLTGPLSGKTVDDLVNMMKTGDVYVNIHTAQHPAGEIRGQVNPS